MNRTKQEMEQMNRTKVQEKPKTCFQSLFWTWKWMNKMEGRRELMWLESLERNTPLGGCKAPR